MTGQSETPQKRINHAVFNKKCRFKRAAQHSASNFPATTSMLSRFAEPTNCQQAT